MKLMPAIISVFLFLSLCPDDGAAQDFARRERVYDAEHYRIEVRFDQPNRMVIGTVTITLSPLRDSITDVELDAVNMTIESVRLPNGRTLGFEYDSVKLTVHLDRPYRYGERLAIAVGYRCTPKRGLYFIQPDASFPNNPEQIWTQGQGEDNRHWLPSYDYPNDKATTEVLMTVNGEYETLSNGFLKARRKNRDGTSTWHWVQDLPHSLYLVMIAVGRYKIHESSYDGIPIHSYHYPSDKPSDVRRTYDATASMVRFFSEKIGIRYPWAKYAQIPVAHYLYGGMENTSATVLADYRTVVDARAALDYSPEALIAHELAHQWWGDYLTYIDWENGWLNEGFATYFQQLWTEHATGRDDFAWLRYEGIQSYLSWTDRTGRIPVVTGRSNSSQNIYAKGAAVLHMLRRLVGDAQFWRIMNRYGKKHALGSVETNDFKRVIEDVTGMSMRWFFDQWLYKAGYPELHVSRTWNSGTGALTVRVSQQQQTDSICGLFRLPVTVRLQFADSTVDRLIWLQGRDTAVSWRLADEPSIVMADPDGTICGRIIHDVTPSELLGLFRGASSLARRIDAGIALVPKLGDPALRTGFFTALTSEPYSGVRLKVASALVQLKPDTTGFADQLKQTFLTLLRDPAANVRSTALNGLNAFRDPALRPAFERALADSSYYVEAAAMNCILSIDSTTTESLVLRKLETPSYRDILAMAALDWVARYRMTNALPIVRRLARPGSGRDLRIKSINTLFELRSNPDTLRRIVDALIEEPYRDFRMFGASLLPVVHPIDAEARLRALVNKERDPRVRGHLETIISKGTNPSR